MTKPGRGGPSQFGGAGKGPCLKVHARRDGFQLADALLEIRDLDPGHARAGAGAGFQFRLAAFQFAGLERQPALPAPQRRNRDDGKAEQKCWR
jgi:hypothetical protein